MNGNGYEFFVDPSRCIGCRACVAACAECDTHRGVSMIHVDYIDRSSSIATTPMVCMHCVEPTCALVCPADAIKQGEDGIVRSALKARCIACSNCVLACPFGIPTVHVGPELMMKCDMCYDRTSIGLRPMCATVCPSQALTFGPAAVIERQRQSVPTRDFRFGAQHVRTKVFMMTAPSEPVIAIDVEDYMEKGPDGSEAWIAGEAGVV
ncbi:MAG TPA: 4Fe-4S dicluster domain-containing protein [Vicinamibacterales bacterium]|nr:4Fe-4S dicluster domain-containing protein [Vicinamibacterales bacterium]